MSAARNYLIVTLSYFLFTLTDGALRMIVLLHFYALGYTPFMLASLFLLYEAAGIFANLSGGWLATRFGIPRMLATGLTVQILGLIMLSALDPGWTATLSVAWVVGAQGLAGVAKDLTKTASKSAIKATSTEGAGPALLLGGVVHGLKERHQRRRLLRRRFSASVRRVPDGALVDGGHVGSCLGFGCAVPAHSPRQSQILQNVSGAFLQDTVRESDRSRPRFPLCLPRCLVRGGVARFSLRVRLDLHGSRRVRCIMDDRLRRGASPGAVSRHSQHRRAEPRDPRGTGLGRPSGSHSCSPGGLDSQPVRAAI